MIQVSGLLRKLDLQIDGLGLKEVITFSAYHKEISYYKELLIQAYQGCECNVLDIIGGKIE